MPTMTQAGYTPPKAEMKKPSKAEPPKKKKKKRKKKGMSGAAAASIVVFAIAVLIGAGTIFVYTQTQPYLQTFVPGTMLMGYPLAGASQQDAQALIDRIAAEQIAPWHTEIVCQNQTYTITAQDVHLDIDREATLAPLWAAGREGGMLSRYVAMLRMRGEPMIMQPVLTYDLSMVDELLEIIRADVECASVDATVEFRPGFAQPFVITDEEMGYALDVSGVKDTIEHDAKMLTAGSHALEPRAIEPAVYRAELENAIELRSRVTVALDGDPASRANAVLAAGKLQGLRIEAGEALSFNETVGARTAENGYLSAPEPAYGEDVSGVGGGVCQVSTALYRAALLADISVSERHGAARPVAYCDRGQEAAVSDQGLDLSIVNQTDSPLFVSARVYEDGDDAFLEMMLIGTRKTEHFLLESIVEEIPAPQEPVYVRDREGRYATYTDERVPVSGAKTGYSVRVERVALDGDGQEIGRKVVSEDVYEAAAPMIYVGVTERE